MQIVNGDITRDITGEIVYLKAYKQMVGEVTEYSTSKNTATVKLCDTGLEITVSLDDIESTGSTQPHRAFNSEVHILGTRYSIRIIDEEMIDWMAIQIPKIQKAYKEAYCDE